MKKVASVLPWVLVAVMASIMAVQYRSANSGPAVSEVTSPNREAAPPVSRNKSAESELSDQLDALQTENETLRDKVSSQAEQIDSLRFALEEANRPSEIAPRTERATEPQMEEDRRARAKRFAEMRLERRYGGFLANLGLTPDHEVAVREALLRVLVDMSGDNSLTNSEYASWMRQEMENLLSPKELAEFDEYQEGLPAQMLRQTFALEVNAMAPGLSEQTRGVVVDVLVEEALLARLTPPPEDAASTYPLIQRMNIYANAAARFEGVLNDQEMAALNRFLNQQYAELEATVATIERAEAAGATTNVEVGDGFVNVEIQESEQRRKSS